MRRSLILLVCSLAILPACKEDKPTPTAEPPTTAAPEPEPAKTSEAKTEDSQSDPKQVDPTQADEKTAEAKDDTGDKDDGKTAEAKDDKPAGKTAGQPKTKVVEAKTDKPEPEAKTEKGDEKSEPQYSAWMQSAGKYTVGKPGTVTAVLVAKGEWKCNDSYPYKVKLNAAPAGVSFGATVARGASISKARTTVSVPFTPTEAGAKTISGKFYFSVCNESTCKIQKAPLSVTVNVGES